MTERCPWCGDDPLYVRYHDEEWGVPVRDDAGLFEMLCLEGQQAGLSWITVLRKREGYRRHFRGFEIERVAHMTGTDIGTAMGDPGVIRHRGKLEAILTNARATLRMREESGSSLSGHLWSFVGGEPLISRFRRLDDIPATTDEARAMSEDLKKRGYAFVGPTTCYAFMQACGMVNDHLMGCPRWREVGG